MYMCSFFPKRKNKIYIEIFYQFKIETRFNDTYFVKYTI